MDTDWDFEKLYRTYYMEVYTFVLTLIKNGEKAEEITQEVFFKALKTNNKYKGNSSERTWLCAIAKNTCVDVLRRQSRFGQMDENEVASGTCIEQMVEDEEMTLRVHQVLHTLEEPYKEVFSLRIFGELSFQSIGKIFVKSESWARVTYYRARLKLQEKMEKDEGGRK